MAGHDLMACAQTGSGKTVSLKNMFLDVLIVYIFIFWFKAAYVLPILSQILEHHATIQQCDIVEPLALILAPTRELADQICKEAKYLAIGI